MIYQMPSASGDSLFVASTLTEEPLAEEEIRAWAVVHGYEPPRDQRTFVFYADGRQPRAWRVISRARTAKDTAH